MVDYRFRTASTDYVSAIYELEVDGAALSCRE